MGTTNTVIFKAVDRAYDVYRADHIQRYELRFTPAGSSTPLVAYMNVSEYHRPKGYDGRFERHVQEELVRSIEREFSKPLREALGLS